MADAGTDNTSFSALLATLHRSHDRLVQAVTPLSADQVAGQSYDDEWSIAQVASHLGSGAEIFELFVNAGVTQQPAPGIDVIQPVWDTWNARTPEQQAAEALGADARLLARVDELTEDDHAGWQLDLFGAPQSPADLLRLRLSEHAVHTWDIAVALDPTATVAEDATGFIIDNLDWMVGRVSKGVDEPTTVSVTTTNPDRRLLLSLTDDSATLTPAASDDSSTADGAASLTLPAEAFVRLVYGRLDADHTPDTVQPDGIDLDTLRRSFPGV